jgi:hypothetical protein
LPAGKWIFCASFLIGFLFSSEAHVSGHAGFILLESRFEYSYSENFRRKVHTDDYEKYWADKRSHFDAVIASSASIFEKFSSELLKLKVEPISPSASDSQFEEIQFKGDRGDSTIRFLKPRSISESQLKELKAFAGKLEYASLAEAADKSGVSASASKGLIDAISVTKAFPKFALSIFLIRRMRKDVAAEMKPRLESALNSIVVKIEAPLNEKIAAGKIWVDPKQLVSFEQKFGVDAQSKLGEQDPTKSVFNPYGPLHDEVGRRTSAQYGMLVASILFLTNEKKWGEDPTFGKNTAEFETWFREGVNRALQKAP